MRVNKKVAVYVYLHTDYIGSVKEAEEIIREYDRYKGLSFEGDYLRDDLAVLNHILREYSCQRDTFLLERDYTYMGGRVRE